MPNTPEEKAYIIGEPFVPPTFFLVELEFPTLV
jgi:hypothetical protein